MKTLIVAVVCLVAIMVFSASITKAEDVPEIYSSMITFTCYDTYCVCNGSQDCYNMGRSGVCKKKPRCVDEMCTCKY